MPSKPKYTEPKVNRDYIFTSGDLLDFIAYVDAYNNELYEQARQTNKILYEEYRQNLKEQRGYPGATIIEPHYMQIIAKKYTLIELIDWFSKRPQKTITPNPLEEMDK